MPTDARTTVFDWVETRRGELSDWNRTIRHFGETAWREYKSAAWYVARPRREGFEVEAGSGGMGGSEWIAPLCDTDPPIGFPWPEYVTTARGEGWRIPA